MRTAHQPHTVEDYLEAIYELAEEGVRVVQARIAQRLGVSRAAVSEQVRRMARAGLVEVQGREIRLTADGYRRAEEAVRRHRMTERFLTDVLGVPWHRAHEEAVSLQATLSEQVESRIEAILRGPATCPHGNPIPGTGAVLDPDLRPLDRFGAGSTVELVRLTEDVELDTEALRYFEEHGLVPGARIEVLAVGPDGSMSLRVGDRQSSLGAGLADNLWVRPAGAG